MEVSVSWYQVKDLESAKKFYGEVLGMTKTFEMGGWAEFSNREGAASIGLAQQTDNGPASGATVVLRVPNIDLARKELSQKGVRFEGDIQEIPGVVKLAAFLDPSGNRLQLCEVLFKE